jgi:hypothetical protein
MDPVPPQTLGLVWIQKLEARLVSTQMRVGQGLSQKSQLLVQELALTRTLDLQPASIQKTGALARIRTQSPQPASNRNSALCFALV